MAATSQAPRPELQFHSLAHQAATAELGMWAFLATEILFFGGMFLAYTLYRSAFPMGFAEGSRHARFIIGTANTVLLVTSSLTMAWAVVTAGTPARRALTLLLVATACLGIVFIGLKGYEYYLDYKDHLVPGAGFAFNRPHARAMELFWFLYFMMTGVHAVHLSIGVGLILYMAKRAHRGDFTAYGKPIEIVGIYWSFVDVIWLFLYPMIYLAGRNTS